MRTCLPGISAVPLAERVMPDVLRSSTTTSPAVSESKRETPCCQFALTVAIRRCVLAHR